MAKDVDWGRTPETIPFVMTVEGFGADGAVEAMPLFSIASIVTIPV